MLDVRDGHGATRIASQRQAADALHARVQVADVAADVKQIMHRLEPDAGAPNRLRLDARLSGLPPAMRQAVVQAWEEAPDATWPLVVSLTDKHCPPDRAAAQWETDRPSWLRGAPTRVLTLAGDLAAAYGATRTARALFAEAVAAGANRRSYWAARAAALYDLDEHDQAVAVLAAGGDPEASVEPLARAMSNVLAQDWDAARDNLRRWRPDDTTGWALWFSLSHRVAGLAAQGRPLDRALLDEILVASETAMQGAREHGPVPTGLRVIAARYLVMRQQITYLRVDDGSTYVAGNGRHVGLSAFSGASVPSTTFQHVRAGTVVYSVGVSAIGAFATSPVRYNAKATLAGKAFDREGECFVGDSGLSRLQEPDDGAVLKLSMRLVTAPADAAEVRTKVIPAVVETYARIKVAVRVSLDVRSLRPTDTYPFEQVQRAYGGVRPPGVDVVHVISDNFAGGFAQCLGGVAYPEKAFSTGSLHYAPEGTVRVPTVYAASIVAHEVGHTLGGQHQMGNCAEALPQQALQPASDGSIGPCTAMSPGAAQISETFSTHEKTVIRSYVRRYARG